ncbi:MAG: lipopolysaccharide heptosyltransferase II [Zetaproteobacteria bacterium]|nr:MAG: lipopolysaccharide heptosyltransferase II [Zetaproteobacteria bacterium]
MNTRVLIMPPNWLGDVIMAQPAMRALRQYYAQARLALYGRPWLRDLVPYLKLGMVDVHAQRPPRADIAYLFPNSFRAAWSAWRSGCRERIGYRGQWRRMLLTEAMAHRVDTRHEHHRAFFLDLVRQSGIPVRDEQVRLSVPKGDEFAVARLLDARGMHMRRLVCVAPGAQFGGAKRYPAPAYARVLRVLAAEGWHIVVLGTAQEQAIGARALAGVEGSVWNACGQTTLREALQLVAACRLLLCNDSGLMHVAAGMGRPTVCIFGATDPARTAPSGPRVRLLYRPAPCSPCLARECRVAGQPCMANIGSDEVLDACREMLRCGC